MPALLFKTKLQRPFFYKVGITTHSIDVRYRLLEKDNVVIDSIIEIKTTIAKAINAEAALINEFQNFLEYRGHILKNAKGGTECFSKDVLDFSGKKLSDYVA